MTLWVHIHEAFRARASEFALGMMMFFMSLVLNINATLFADNPAAYAGLASVFSQPVWGILCAVVGGSRLIVLIVNGWWSRSPMARCAAAFLSCFVWFNLSWGAFAAETFGIELAIYPVLLLFDSYNVMRTIDDAVAAARARRIRTHAGTYS